MRSRLAPSLSIAAIVDFEDAGERAAPAGMGGADDARLGVGEEDRPAIGGADADARCPAGW